MYISQHCIMKSPLLVNTNCVALPLLVTQCTIQSGAKTLSKLAVTFAWYVNCLKSRFMPTKSQVMFDGYNISGRTKKSEQLGYRYITQQFDFSKLSCLWQSSGFFGSDTKLGAQNKKLIITLCAILQNIDVAVESLVATHIC